MRSILRSHVKVIELLENIIHENFGWQHVTSKLTSLCLTLIMSSSFFINLLDSQAAQIFDLAKEKYINMSKISILILGRLIN